ncbi:MAG: SDR family NAD(P)-dependent oxidoreductase, partial [Clostridia bacterium]|nr:SDR family NAD(P)-dependent oxidoreductase [Clostridia bacterium]
MINNKRIVLTGANSGIGLEVLKLLAEGDNKILAVDLHTDKIDMFDSEKVVPMIMDVSKKENVDLIFERAIEVLGDIDIFYANAGYPYYELFDYTNWERVERMFETNVFSPIYSYSKYVEYLNGREGQFAITVSAIGTMAVPGYTIYSA